MMVIPGNVVPVFLLFLLLIKKGMNVKSDFDLTYNQIALRAAIGIRSQEFEISDRDYDELLTFSQALSYEEFCKACENVGAKYPSKAKYQKILETDFPPPEPTAEEIAERRRIAQFHKDQEAADAARGERNSRALAELVEASPRMGEYVFRVIGVSRYTSKPIPAFTYDAMGLDRLAWDAETGKTAPITREEALAVKKYYAVTEKHFPTKAWVDAIQKFESDNN